MAVVTYLDWASTAPLHPAAREALMGAYEQGWADPARLYTGARRARQALEAARESLAASLGARADEVWLTSSGTQAVHLGLLGMAGGRGRVGSAVVAGAVEHSSVLHAASAVGEPALVPVDRQGRVDVDAFRSAVAAPGVALACLQSANHEVGTTQPVEAVAESCAAGGVPLLVDAAQSVGRVPVPDGWQALTASAHKWGGPAGVGVLVVRKGTRWASPLPPDERGWGRVPGFENVPGAVAAAAALSARLEECRDESVRLSDWVARLREAIPAVIPDCQLLGDPVDRLPHILTVSFLYVEGEALLSALDAEGISASSGSSCTASTLEPSHVLAAMGALTHGNLRLSLGRDTTEHDVERLLAVLPGAVAAVRERFGAGGL